MTTQEQNRRDWKWLQRTAFGARLEAMEKLHTTEEEFNDALKKYHLACMKANYFLRDKKLPGDKLIPIPIPTTGEFLSTMKLPMGVVYG